jgi:hypothetical protein
MENSIQRDAGMCSLLQEEYVSCFVAFLHHVVGPIFRLSLEGIMQPLWRSSTQLWILSLTRSTSSSPNVHPAVSKIEERSMLSALKARELLFRCALDLLMERVCRSLVHKDLDKELHIVVQSYI